MDNNNPPTYEDLVGMVAAAGEQCSTMAVSQWSFRYSKEDESSMEFFDRFTREVWNINRNVIFSTDPSNGIEL